MIKRLLTYTLLLLAITSCKKDSSYSSYTEEVSLVEYEISTGDLTRATIVTNSASMESVGVLGAATETSTWASDPVWFGFFDLIPNRKLWFNGTSWDYIEGEEVSWNSPAANDMFTFFAYSPYEYNVKGDTYTGSYSETYTDPDDGATIIRTEWPEYNGYPSSTVDLTYPILHYDCPEQYYLQRDVLLAEPQTDIYRPVSNHVPLIFHHALTCVGFQVRELVDLVTNLEGEEASTGVREITKVWIEGIYSRGSVKMNGNDMTWIPDMSDPRDKQFVAGTSTDEGEDYYTLTANASVDEPYSTNFMNADGYMMLMPQNLPATTAKIKVAFTNGDEYEYSLSGEWTANKRVVYNITIGAMGITSVDTSNYEWEQSLIFLSEGTFSIDGVESDDWTGAIVSSDFEVGGAGDLSGSTSSGTDGAVSSWEGYVSPGYTTDIGGESGTTTGTTGTSGSDADIWEGYISSGGDNVGGATDTSSSSSGSSGDDSEDWEGGISSGGDSVGGATDSSSSESGSSGDDAESWDGYISSGGDSVGGATDSSSSESGSSGDDAESWDGYISSGGDTVGGATDTSTSESGSSGSDAEGWEGGVVTDTSLDINEEELEVSDTTNTENQWESNTTIVGGENTDTSGLVDTSITPTAVAAKATVEKVTEEETK